MRLGTLAGTPGCLDPTFWSTNAQIDERKAEGVLGCEVEELLDAVSERYSDCQQVHQHWKKDQDRIGPSRNSVVRATTPFFFTRY
jgi:hypothetical protein